MAWAWQYGLDATSLFQSLVMLASVLSAPWPIGSFALAYRLGISFTHTAWKYSPICHHARHAQVNVRQTALEFQIYIYWLGGGVQCFNRGYHTQPEWGKGSLSSA
ncbi:hypothetical protein BDZ89DRAFT_1040017 [Hymenopellis radicata]|nr:hypothetical protein BDZ89DRAFT_1040017 [Hymenopellis radicata]